jgi:hypothetical protein
VLLVWQDHDRNEWATATREALTGVAAAPARSANDPDPFSLADPAITTGILTAAGFDRLDFTRPPPAGLLRPRHRHRL